MIPVDSSEVKFFFTNPDMVGLVLEKCDSDTWGACRRTCRLMRDVGKNHFSLDVLARKIISNPKEYLVLRPEMQLERSIAQIAVMKKPYMIALVPFLQEIPEMRKTALVAARYLDMSLYRILKRAFTEERAFCEELSSMSLIYVPPVGSELWTMPSFVYNAPGIKGEHLGRISDEIKSNLHIMRKLLISPEGELKVAPWYLRKLPAHVKNDPRIHKAAMKCLWKMGIRAVGRTAEALVAGGVMLAMEYPIYKNSIPRNILVGLNLVGSLCAARLMYKATNLNPASHRSFWDPLRSGEASGIVAAMLLTVLEGGAMEASTGK